MSTSNPEHAIPEAEGPDRLSVRQTKVHESAVDGAWWPHSSDLTVELPKLLTSLWGNKKPTDMRVAYRLGAWDAAPRKIFIGDRMIRLGGFVHQDPLVISVSGAALGVAMKSRVDLLVIDPATPPHLAAAALRLAAAPDCTLTPAQILERAAHNAVTV